MSRGAMHNSAGLEIKALGSDGAFAGYASVFDVVDNQRDVVRRGAFKATLAHRKQPVQLLWQHQWDSPIGVITALFEDRRGLYVEGRLLLGVARARDAYALLKGGAIRGLSIGFTVEKARHNVSAGTREIDAVNLYEVSLVTLPANDAAQVTVVKHHAVRQSEKAMDALVAGLKRAETALRPHQ